MPDNSFTALLGAVGGLSAPEIELLDRYRDLVLAENEVQNLTRLTSPADFVQGHVLDCIELKKAGYVLARPEAPAVDLGSGAGVPGIICSILGMNPWVLVESEVRKAEFLERAVQDLNLGSTVRVVARRGEDFLKNARASAVVSRAVGTIDKIYGWIRPCSTWNTLILFKGPSWAKEWAEFKSSRQGAQLSLVGQWDYVLGEEKKFRTIVKLDRVVPRGTR